MTDEASRDLHAHRRYLMGVAYRMLGEVAEAEDVVQDAYLRWREVDRTTVTNARAYLTQVVTRLCLDRLKEARRRRESYVGEWLPEPLVEEVSASVVDAAAVAENVSYALMLALERLTPLERAAFLLHDIFDLAFEEVAETLGRSVAACRQLASRARARVQEARRRFTVDPDHSERLLNAFFLASQSGNTTVLQELLAKDAVLHSDGGGRKLATLRPIFGADKICRLYAGLARKRSGEPPRWWRMCAINGLPGLVTVEHDGTLQTVALELANGRISGIYVVRNPDKLAHVAPLVPNDCWEPEAAAQIE